MGGVAVIVSFSIPGEPARMTYQQKGISWKRRVVYTKSEVAAEKRRVVSAAKKYAPASPTTGPVYVSLRVVFPLTKEQAARHADRLSDTSFTIPHTKKPDADNNAKLILDALTACGFWKDDCQVCDLFIRKRYGVQPEIRVVITSL